MADHPDLARFRDRIGQSSDSHLSHVDGHGAGVGSREHWQGKMTPDERRRQIDQAAARIDLGDIRG